jgi:hypothetical protein
MTTNTTTPLHFVARIEEGSLTGFTLDEALGEAVGYASMCWTDRVIYKGKYGRSDVTERVFDSDKAHALIEELRGAVKAAVAEAVEQAQLGAATGWANHEVADLLLQQEAFGFASHEEDQR